ncbi:hypothetical protein Btru_050251, partial [Bulinus truncatus]
WCDHASLVGRRMVCVFVQMCGHGERCFLKRCLASSVPYSERFQLAALNGLKFLMAARVPSIWSSIGRLKTELRLMGHRLQNVGEETTSRGQHQPYTFSLASLVDGGGSGGIMPGVAALSNEQQVVYQFREITYGAFTPD